VAHNLEFQAPTQQGNTVRVGWQVTYTKAGCPDLVISGTEVAEFQGDQIASLTDIMNPGIEETMGEWMGAHGAKLSG
jgi:hypothetical protein